MFCVVLYCDDGDGRMHNWRMRRGEKDHQQGLASYYRLHLRSDIERCCEQGDICAASRGPSTRSWGLIHQHSVGAPYERIATDIVPFPDSNSGNISPDRDGLLHEVTRSSRHPQPRGIDSGRRSSHQFLLLLWRPNGDAQCLGLDL